MEYEISDQPQDLEDHPEGDRDGGITDDMRSLRNQSSVQPGDYPKKDRNAQTLTPVEADNS